MSNLLILGGSKSKPKPVIKIPTRDEACKISCPFQGLYVNTKYGRLPWWSTVITSFEDEIESICSQILAAGFTHEIVSLVWNYGEPGQPYGSGQTVPPCDLRNDLDKYNQIVDRVASTGLIPILMMPGEGKDGVNWILSDSFKQVVDHLGVRKTYGPFWFGYDGTWPEGWSVDDVKAVFPHIRSVIGNDASFGIMFGNGPENSPYFYVEDESDYSKPWMQCLDIIGITTGPDQAQDKALSNGMQYLTHVTGPRDWVHEPPLTVPGTPRGPYYTGLIEWKTFAWVRQWQTWNGIPSDQASIIADRERMRAEGVQPQG